MTHTLKQNAPLVIILLLGFACGQGWGQDSGRETPGAPEQSFAPGRYELEACGSQYGNAAYVLDTHTGDVFYVTNSGRPRRVGSVGE